MLALLAVPGRMAETLVRRKAHELVMATTFSPSATVWIIDRWQKEPGSG